MKLDGSYGEGGGQILRTAVALSAVTGEPVEINNIRKNRPKPGLSAQHVKAVESAAALCNGHVKGCSLHSTDLTFMPGKIKGGEYEINIGTAGSITLILQCLMPIAMHSPSAVRLKISGGTDVSWSPTIDYMRFVTLFALSRMGYDGNISIVRRGYYPCGDGCVEAVIAPAKLKQAEFEANTCSVIQGRSHSSRLPLHVTQRQASAARKLLQQEGFDARIAIETKDDSSTGSGLTLWCGYMGGSALGKPGFSAEKVGILAADVILSELKSQAGVDEYLADQLIPYMALAGGGSFTTRNISLHTKTNIWVTEQFLDVKFNIHELETGIFRVSI
ncbi:MAG: RNA 3'-terminal phosphate cyclase [Candidatus Methanoperedens sp.]|nr:RNA 3'-terminal phosphate cyclase [Candidatus Methanoperedens sp.]